MTDRKVRYLLGHVFLTALIAALLSTALSGLPTKPREDSRVSNPEEQNPDRIQTVSEESLRLELSGNNEFIELSLENISSRPLRYMIFGDGENTELLPYGLLLKARDAEGRMLVSQNLDYWRGFWSPVPYPKDLSGLKSWELEPHSARRHKADISKIMQLVPFREQVEYFKFMVCVFRTPSLNEYWGDTESPWIHYRPVTQQRPRFKSG